MRNNNQYYLMYFDRDRQVVCRQVEKGVYDSIKSNVANYFQRDLSEHDQTIHIKAIKHLMYAEAQQIWDNFFFPANMVAILAGGL